MRISYLLPLCCLAFFLSCNNKEKRSTAIQEQAQTYLDAYNKKYQELFTASSLGQWKLNTRIVKGDTLSEHEAGVADKELAQFQGSNANIDSAKKYLALKDQLTPLQLRQFEVILFYAGANPEAAGNIVDRRIKANNNQTSLLYGFKYAIDGRPVNTTIIDSILENSNDLSKRLSAWEASKEVGKTLRTGLDSLQYLRNASVTPLGFTDFFDYTSHGYGMTGDEMLQLTHSFIKDVWPLYRELHTWARYELAARYHQPVPDYIPAHWLFDRWGQDWASLVQIEGLSIDSVLKQHGSEWIAKQGEQFYQSLGFDALPVSFWKNSSLYPVPPDSPFTKNNHASAWHVDLDKDVRSLQSIVPTTDYWSTVMHEFGHIYYYQSYSNPNVPYLLRDGANSGFHEAFGSMIGMASLQKPFLEARDLIKKGLVTNDTMQLLQEALKYIVIVPWGSGVMTEFEYNLYHKNLPSSQYNKLWWELVKKYQGIVPPTERGESYCDAATKTHINDAPAYYYNYTVANVLQFQFHQYIAENILHQDPHATNYWGNKQVGDFLKKVMSPGSSIPWRQNLKDNLHSDISATSLTNYFKLLMPYLKRLNSGRKYTLPEQL